MRIFNFNPLELRRFDLPLAFLTFGLCLSGAFIIWGSAGEGDGIPLEARKHLIWTALGLVVFLVFCFLDMKTVEWASYPFYGVCLVLLGYLLIFGDEIAHTHSWLKLGPMRLQPSELTKVAMVLVLAAHFAQRRTELNWLTGLLAPALIVGAPCLLTILQGDTGTAMVFVPVFLVMIFMAGLRKRTLVWLFAVGLLVTVIALPHLKEYHVARIALPLGKRNSTPLLLALGRDPGKIWDRIENEFAWQSEQSHIALGSGRLFGKGWKKGTQTVHDFLPTHKTDFVFASLGEQFGLAGCLLLAAAYAIMIRRGLRIALDAHDMFASLAVVGFLAVFIVHIAINVGMVTGLLPIIGVPLPFLSYGGSFLITVCAMFGLIVNIGMKKFLY